MVRTGRPKAELVLSGEERATLEGWVRRGSTPQAWALRCRIILACASGASNKDVAAQVGSTAHAVGRWRSRFVQYRLAGLGDMPRRGGPRTVTDEQVAEVVHKTLGRRPKDAPHWSTRSMAQEMGLSQSTVSRIWRAFGLQPHRCGTFGPAADHSAAERVHDVAGLYLDPPERALVLRVDRSDRTDRPGRVPAPGRSRPGPAMMPGIPEQRSADGARDAVAALSDALAVAVGDVIGSLCRCHRAEEFLAFLAGVDKEVPEDLDVHLVCDNYATHKTAAVRKWLQAHPRFHLHLTPSGLSWQILAERWLAELSDERPENGIHESIGDLETGIRSWATAWNGDPRPYVWTRAPRPVPDLPSDI